MLLIFFFRWYRSNQISQFNKINFLIIQDALTAIKTSIAIYLDDVSPQTEISVGIFLGFL
jgi:hypothetical protein